MSAAFLPPPPRPPHDPLWRMLGGCAGWPLAAGVNAFAVDPSGALTLAPLAGSYPVLGDKVFGGLALPANMAFGPDAGLWLIDRGRNKIRIFDPCICAFVDLACGQAKLVDPRAIAIVQSRVYIADAAGALWVIDAPSMVLRNVLNPPGGGAWQPVAIAADNTRIFVGDAASGKIHVFAVWGGWLGSWSGASAPSRLMLDMKGRLYSTRADSDVAEVRNRAGQIVDRESDPAAVAGCFAPLPFAVDSSGALDLGGICPGAGWFDSAGMPTVAPQPSGPVYPPSGIAITAMIDSEMARCQWHRLLVRGAVPRDAGLIISTTTAEAPLTDAVIAALPPSSWAQAPLGGGPGEALIMSPPGRYAWLRVELASGTSRPPSIDAIDVEYPRISLRRHLPAAFAADEPSSLFLDRMLGVFDAGFRDIETQIDGQAALFDPRATPLLDWLASWIGIRLDKRWSEQQRRTWLRSASKFFACRGTEAGLRGVLLLWLGWDTLAGRSQSKPACGPRCAPSSTPLPLPTLVLEHWKLRRWLHLGTGRLGDASVLWGARILGRSQLDTTAQVDGTRLDAVRDPLRDPFHENAQRISVFLPAAAVENPVDRGAAQRLLAEHVPAHVEARIVPVRPRMRIGIQASIGLDAVVGCWPSGITLGESGLGRGTILSAAAPRAPRAPRLGRDARLQSTSFRGSTGEARP